MAQHVDRIQRSCYQYRICFTYWALHGTVIHQGIYAFWTAQVTHQHAISFEVPNTNPIDWTEKNYFFGMCLAVFTVRVRRVRKKKGTASREIFENLHCLHSLESLAFHVSIACFCWHFYLHSYSTYFARNYYTMIYHSSVLSMLQSWPYTHTHTQKQKPCGYPNDERTKLKLYPSFGR